MRNIGRFRVGRAWREGDGRGREYTTWVVTWFPRPGKWIEIGRNYSWAGAMKLTAQVITELKKAGYEC